MSVPASEPPGALAHLPILVTVTLWGFQLPAINALAERWDAATLNLVRYIVAAAAFLVLLRLSRHPPSPSATRLTARGGVGLGGLFAAFGMLYTLGAAIGDPVLLVTATAFMPVTASIVSWTLTGRPPERALLLALVPAVPGAILATPEPSAGGEPGAHPAIGFALVLTAQVCWSVYSLALPRALPQAGPLARTRLSVLWSMPFHVAFWIGAWTLGIGRVEPGDALLVDALLIAAVALGPLVVGVMLWNRSVERLGLPLCALYLNLVPLVGAGIAAAFGTVPSGAQIVGMALVVLGMGLAQARRRDGRHRPRVPRV